MVRTKQNKKPAAKPAVPAKEKRVTFTVDVATPVQHGIFDADAFKQFLEQRIKVNGKKGLLGDAVKVSLADNILTVDARAPFSKRYIKYLTKKFLKKATLRDWLRVVATNKTNYQLRYFNIHDNDNE